MNLYQVYLLVGDRWVTAGQVRAKKSDAAIRSVMKNTFGKNIVGIKVEVKA